MDNMNRQSGKSCDAKVPQYITPLCGLSKFKPSRTNLAANPLLYIKGIKGRGAKILINNLSHLI
jgi:hypothetical protein